MTEIKFSAILAAGGSGTRFGGEVNKVYLPYRGQPVISYSLDKFLQHPLIKEIICVYRKEDEALILPLLADKGRDSEVPLLAVPGGASRRASVYQGLKLSSSAYVIVHDAARPFWKPEWIDALAEVMREVPGATVAIPSPDTVKLADENGRVTATTDRTHTFLVQTPQAFHRDMLLKAHETLPPEAPATDDCGMLEQIGCPVQLIPGSPRNRKLTVPEDAVWLSADTDSVL